MNGQRDRQKNMQTINFFYIKTNPIIRSSVSTDQALNRSPELTASFISRLLFAWFDKTVWRGRSKTIDESDVWDLNPEDR